MSEKIPSKQQAYTLYLQIQQVLDAHPGGGADPDSLHDIESLGRQLKWKSSLFDEKVDSLLIWAGVLYSPRKHARWDAPMISGSDRVRDHILQDLVSIKDIIERMSDVD
ncbi:MAG: hypothetical protein ABR865_02985 [Terracidiphilus sp.]|jgi:hypothetical protein